VKTLTGIEIQKTLFDFSVLNSKVNNLSDNCSFFNFDIRDSQVHILKEKSFELVVSNPPFWAKNQGRLSVDDQRRIARHEIEGTLSDFARVAHRILHPVKGRFCIAFPASRVNYLVDSLNRNSLYVSRIIPVYPLREKSAELLLVESKCKQEPSAVFETPLYLKDENNKDSELLNKIVSGEY
jgi:tRNA1Val (adenine37-N6)-methyltransferase